MQVLGHGAQFEVVADGDHVIKTMHTVEESAAVYKSWHYGLIVRDLEGLASDTLDCARTSLQGIRAILEDHPELGSSLANPVIDDDSSYRQDRVTVMGEALRNRSGREARYLVDQYVDLNLFHASFGFADKVFNAGVNNGVDENGKVVLLDLGELTFDKELAMQAAATKRWMKAYSFWDPLPYPKNYSIPLPLKPYYYRRMSAKLTSEAVELNWDTR
jgi:hypothetical protein